MPCFSPHVAVPKLDPGISVSLSAIAGAPSLYSIEQAACTQQEPWKGPKQQRRALCGVEAAAVSSEGVSKTREAMFRSQCFCLQEQAAGLLQQLHQQEPSRGPKQPRRALPSVAPASHGGVSAAHAAWPRQQLLLTPGMGSTASVSPFPSGKKPQVCMDRCKVGASGRNKFAATMTRLGHCSLGLL